MGALETPALVIAAILGIIVVGVVLLLFAIQIFKGIGFILAHLWRFVSGEVMDLLRLVGAVLTGLVFVPMTLGNVVIGRWSAASHFGRSFGGEVKNFGAALYRILLGHPAKLLFLGSLTEGFEKRLPLAVAEAPGADLPSKRTGQFEGYKIIGSLPGGGSGGRLYVAEPDATKRAAFTRAGRADIRQVVIKAFTLGDGSSLPQIVRESRSLDAARKLGLVLDHDLTPQRFYYVMEYVPGQSLAHVTQQLHASSGPQGLDDSPLRTAMAYVVDLLRTLDLYHRGGLWHKDVKPDNIIVDGQRAHLVDFGLVTPLRSAMTLTTHGTEYFRDPEMVRLALKGVKVHEVDGTRFDIFAAGAVMYSVIENSFPAHGVLSQITRRCPEALRWIVRRAMTDYDKRYATAGAMADDLTFVARAIDPFAVKPFELPSMRGSLRDDTAPSAQVDPEIAQVAAAATPRPLAGDFAAPTPPTGKKTGPKITLANWWTGKYHADAPTAPPTPSGPSTPSVPLSPKATLLADGLAQRRAPRSAESRLPAAEQLARARARVEAARARGTARYARRRAAGARPFETKVNAGVVVSTLLFVAGCIVGTVALVERSHRGSRTVVTSSDGQTTSRTVIEALDRNSPGEGQSWASTRITLSGDSPEAITIPASDTPPTPDTPRIYEIGTQPRFGSTPPTTPAPILVAKPGSKVSGKMLVIVDLPKPLSPARKAAVTQITGAMQDAGLSLFGDYPGNQAPAEELARQIELTARAIAACGQVQPRTDSSKKLLGEWIAASSVDLVLWISTADESEDQASLDCALLGPSEPKLNPAEAAASRERFETLMKVLGQ